MRAWRLLLFGALSAALGIPGRADESLRGVFATVHSSRGGTWLLDLHVPKSGGGACELRGISVATTPTVTSPPVPVIRRPGLAVPAAGASSTAYPAPAPIYQTGPGISPQVAMEISLHALVLPEIGPLTTRDSTAYSNCRLVAFQTDGVIVLHDAGLTKIMFSDLDPASRAQVEAVR